MANKDKEKFWSDIPREGPKETILQMMLDHADCRRVDVHKFIPRSGQTGSCLFTIPGCEDGGSGAIDYESTFASILEAGGPGRYRFVTVQASNGEWGTSRLIPLGDPEAEDAPQARRTMGLLDVPGTLDEAEREVLRMHKRALGRAEISATVADLERKAAERELAPQKMLTDMMSGFATTLSALMGALAKNALTPAAQTPSLANDPFVAMLVQQAKEQREEIAALRREQMTLVKELAVKPAEGDLTEKIRGIRDAARMLGMGGTAEKEAGGVWTPEGVSTILQTALPFVQDALSRFRPASAPGEPVPTSPALPAAPAATGGDIAMPKLPPEAKQIMDAIVEELARPEPDYDGLEAFLDSIPVDGAGNTLLDRIAPIARTPERLARVSLQALDARLLVEPVYANLRRFFEVIKRRDEEAEGERGS